MNHLSVCYLVFLQDSIVYGAVNTIRAANHVFQQARLAPPIKEQRFLAGRRFPHPVPNLTSVLMRSSEVVSGLTGIAWSRLLYIFVLLIRSTILSPILACHCVEE